MHWPSENMMFDYLKSQSYDDFFGSSSLNEEHNAVSFFVYFVLMINLFIKWWYQVPEDQDWIHFWI